MIKLPFYEMPRHPDVKDARSLSTHFLDFSKKMLNDRGEVSPFCVFVFDKNVLWTPLGEVFDDDESKHLADAAIRMFAKDAKARLVGFAFVSEGWMCEGVSEGEIVGIELGIEPRVRDRPDRKEVLTVAAEWEDEKPLTAQLVFRHEGDAIVCDPPDFRVDTAQGIFIGVLPKT